MNIVNDINSCWSSLTFRYYSLSVLIYIIFVIVNYCACCMLKDSFTWFLCSRLFMNAVYLLKYVVTIALVLVTHLSVWMETTVGSDSWCGWITDCGRSFVGVWDSQAACSASCPSPARPNNSLQPLGWLWSRSRASLVSDARLQPCKCWPLHFIEYVFYHPQSEAGILFSSDNLSVLLSVNSTQ